jgi:Fic-DOC domain mobile mystery protein B
MCCGGRRVLANPHAALFDIEDGQTPLDPDEAVGLKLGWIATRSDLNDAEGANIVSGMRWGNRQIRGKKPAEVATEGFLRALHARMFSDVWRWAGTFRQTERNIGVAPYQIAMQLRQLFDNVAAWQEYGAYSLDMQAVTLHHKLTVIHPFPNGNGRCSRVMADFFLQRHAAEPFSWGPAPHGAAVRKRYLEAIRQADAGDMQPLLAFVRS